MDRRGRQGRLRGPVNIGMGKPVAIGEVAARIGALVGRPGLIRLGDLPYREGEVMFVCANPQLLRSSTD